MQRKIMFKKNAKQLHNAKLISDDKNDLFSSNNLTEKKKAIDLTLQAIYYL